MLEGKHAQPLAHLQILTLSAAVATAAATTPAATAAAGLEAEAQGEESAW
jgi:hypothetical protein